MRTPRRIRVLAASVALGVAGTVAIAAPASGATKKPAVTVKTFRFRPATLEVDAGTTVRWKNKDAIEHTVTSDDSAPSAFDGTLSGAGTKFSVRLEEPGSYEYFCSRHPSMRGTIVVS